MGKINDLVIDKMNNERATELRDFLIVATKGNPQLHLVNSPDNERIIGVKTTNIFQDHREWPVLTFTAYCYLDGWVHLGVMPRGDAITVVNDTTIAMPNGKEYKVISAIANVTNDKQQAPMCTVCVYCKIIADEKG